MQVEKAPLESYADVGGLEQQVQEIKEAVELPLTHPELYEDIGIKPPKVCAVAPWMPSFWQRSVCRRHDWSCMHCSHRSIEHINTETERSFTVASAQSLCLGTATASHCDNVTNMRGCAGRDPVWGARHGEDAAGQGGGKQHERHIPARGGLGAHPEVPWGRPEAGPGAVPRGR